MAKNCIVVIYPKIKSDRDDLLFKRKTRRKILAEEENVCVKFFDADTNFSKKNVFEKKEIFLIIFNDLSNIEIRGIIKPIVSHYVVKNGIYYSINEYKNSKNTVMTAN